MNGIDWLAFLTFTVELEFYQIFCLIFLPSNQKDEVSAMRALRRRGDVKIDKLKKQLKTIQEGNAFSPI